MYLKALEINGFKSFAKKGHFDFTSQISGIVGPNGSGKSNVAESFRFVLGEQSLKNMRSKKGTDLIFAGKAGQLNRASVAVTFDNSKKTLDIDYTEVTVERVVLRDGTNEYYINSNKVRAKDVVELLAGANIGSTGHHIISQGEADKILMINPRERKHVIEDALGLKVFTIKKNEAVRKLDRTAENLKEVKLQERTNAPRMAFLKREVEKIERSRTLREELRGLYKLYFPQKNIVTKQLQDLESRSIDVQASITDQQGTLTETRAQLEASSSDSLKADLEKKRLDLDMQIRALRTEKNELERHVGKLDAVIEIELSKQKQSEVLTPKDGDRLETVSAGIHDIWMKWAGLLMDQETLSEDRTARWQSRMVDYGSLPEDSKDKDREHAAYILTQLGEAPAVKVVFDAKILEQYENERLSKIESIDGISKKESDLQPQLDALELELGSPELASQKIMITILEIEKRLTQLESDNRDLERQVMSAKTVLQRFETEGAHAVDLYGQESQSFYIGKADEQADLNLQEKIIRTRALLENAGNITSEDALGEYQELEKQSVYIKSQIADLEQTSESLGQLITELDSQIEEKFRAGMDLINTSFNQFFKTLFSGGHAELSVVNVPVGKSDDEDLQEYELGVEMVVSLPNKKISSLSMLSGGERSLTSIALLFAMSQVAPPPFIILDETDAALDEANSKRYGDMVEQLAKHSQLIVITHNRETMSRAGILYGVTMADDGASRLLSVSLDEAEAVAK